MFSSQKETITQNKNNIVSKQKEIGKGFEHLSNNKKAKNIIEKRQKKETNYSNTLSNCMNWSCTFLKLLCVAWTRECWSLGMRFVKIYGILLSHTAYGVI